MDMTSSADLLVKILLVVRSPGCASACVALLEVAALPGKQHSSVLIFLVIRSEYICGLTRWL